MNTLTEFNKISRSTKVSAKTLIPKQQTRIASKILRSADCYQQRFVKFNDIAIFHSYAELLHAALLESDPDVSTFTPQPFSLRVGKRQYPPDCYYVKNGNRIVVELKPNGEFDDSLKVPLEQFFELQNMSFKVISNESIFEKEVFALNWLEIIRILIMSQNEDTEVHEYKIWDKFVLNPIQSIGDIISIGDRIYSREKEISLFRLIHRGKLSIHFNDKELNYDSEVRLCD